MGDKKNQAQLPLFIAVFEDETRYIGGNSYFETKWTSMPLKKIKRVFYKISTGDYICLDGYDKYFYMIEATKDVLRVRGNKQTKLNSKPKIEYIYFLGKLSNMIISYRVTLFNRKNEKFHMGDITIRKFDEKDKFTKGLNPAHWR